MDPNFVKPLYNSGGFASLPGRIIDLLTAADWQYEAVVLLLIDSFGWRFVAQSRERERFLRTDRTRPPLIPAGSVRDFFWSIKDGLVDEAQEFLAPRLKGGAEVCKVAELVEAGCFGPRLSPDFRARAGELVILPCGGESVWWHEKGKIEQTFRGHHGGLTREEVEIPLISLPIE